jgi:hypothetical protein
VNISYTVPLQNAWSRMKRMLFSPFRIEAWLVIGFAAFLSEYRWWGSSGSHYNSHTHRGEFPHELFRRIVDFFSHPLGLVLILWIMLAALAAFVLLTWISSRGKFIFLDNVVREHAGIVEPWRRFKRLGNSLFRWRLGFGIATLFVVGIMLFPFLVAIGALLHEDSFNPAHLLVLLPLAAMFVPFVIIAAYISLFLSSFVVPIMYRYDLSATAAWGRFLGLLRRTPGYFAFYCVFMLVLAIGVSIAVFAIGIGTCCIGFLLLGAPYVGSVLTLPLEVTGRALGPEFLAQFDPGIAALITPAPMATGTPSATPPTGGGNA